jgi:acyl dehydratase
MDLAGGIIGAGVEGLRWPSALKAGESIQVRVTILAVRPSKSKPSIGIVTFKVETLRADGSAVQEMTGTLVVPRRSAG